MGDFEARFLADLLVYWAVHDVSAIKRDQVIRCLKPAFHVIHEAPSFSLTTRHPSQSQRVRIEARTFAQIESLCANVIKNLCSQSLIAHRHSSVPPPLPTVHPFSFLLFLPS
jgi:hypothetical protein